MNRGNKRIDSEIDGHNLCWNLTEIEYKKMMTGGKLYDERRKNSSTTKTGTWLIAIVVSVVGGSCIA